jgi:ribosomal protein L22
MTSYAKKWLSGVGFGKRNKALLNFVRREEEAKTAALLAERKAEQEFFELLCVIAQNAEENDLNDTKKF